MMKSEKIICFAAALVVILLSQRGEALSAVGDRQIIQPGESLLIERGTVAAYGGKGIFLETQKVSLGVFQSFYNSFWTGESVWENKFTAGDQPGWVILDGSWDLAFCLLEPGESLYSVKGSLLARDAWIDLSSSLEGIQGYFSGLGCVLQKLSNTGNKAGRVFITHKEGKMLCEIQIKEEDGPVFVDAENLVGFTSRLSHVLSAVEAKDAWTRIASKECYGTLFKGVGSVFISVGKRELPPSKNSKDSSEK